MDKVQGILWYTPESHASAIEIMIDKHNIPRTYELWREAAERTVQGNERLRVRMVKVEFDPKEFRTWCSARGRNFDARARSDFADDAAKGLMNGN